MVSTSYTPESAVDENEHAEKLCEPIHLLVNQPGTAGDGMNEMQQHQLQPFRESPPDLLHAGCGPM
jgi:hypothetical protein